jgi:glycosyltransferase involved in cell wall biosynthesis
MMGRMRVGGAVWQALHYLIGLEKLGYETYYVETHGRMPWAFQDKESEAAAFIDSVLRRFDLGNRWAFHARSGSNSYYGMSEYQVNRLYESAVVILNLHGATIPSAEQSASGRLVYIDTDPVTVQVDLHHGRRDVSDILQQHCALFTFGENYGRPDCKLPVFDQFRFKSTRQPVVLDFWESINFPTVHAFTTIGNWKQLHRVVEYNGEEYYWSKHLEFLKVLDLPGRANQTIELALSACDDEARQLLINHGWNVRDALMISQDLDTYREYILQSKGEFSVAKDQNIRLRTGWFSDRSATYLAGGRPVVTQETGFSNILPTGEGLLAFSNLDEAASAIESINGNYKRHRKAANEIAHEYFSHDVVLTQLLSDLGLRRDGSRSLNNPADQISVNVVGDAGSYTGMAAIVERYMRVLEWLDVPVTLIDSSSQTGSLNLAPRSSGGKFEINLVCCEVASHFSMRARLGPDFFRDRYNIAVWLWESPNFPKEWYDRFVYYDEIWAPTSFIASSLSPISPVPVVHMPLVLEPERSGSRSEGRRRLGIGNEEFVYLFVFNFYSRFQRKNPMAVIEAFKRSFEPNESARLIIKCTNASFSCESFRQMRTEAEGHRISIYDGGWSEQELCDLMAACDCYVSLHRAEGVGLTISDAMAAGKPVVATGWSGNMDFMTVSNSFPVRYQLMNLKEKVAHYRPGDTWAEPSIEHAAETLRYVFDHREEAAQRGEAARNDIRSAYSADIISSLVSGRIAVILKQRQFQSMKDSLATLDGANQLNDEFSDLGEYVPETQFRYERLKAELRRAAQIYLPPDATLAVVSRGDDELLRLDERRAWHFPLHVDYQYAGYHPKDSAEAIQQVEEVRSKGAEFLLFPQTAFWWLDHYADFRQHLLARYKVAHRDEWCVMFELK